MRVHQPLQKSKGPLVFVPHLQEFLSNPGSWELTIFKNKNYGELRKIHKIRGTLKGFNTNQEHIKLPKVVSGNQAAPVSSSSPTAGPSSFDSDPHPGIIQNRAPVIGQILKSLVFTRLKGEPAELKNLKESIPLNEKVSSSAK